MASGGEQIENLWKTTEGFEASRGPLFDVRNQLSDSFHLVDKLTQQPIEIEKHGNSLHSPVVFFKAKTSPYSASDKKTFSFVAKARQTETNAILLAIQEQARNKNDGVSELVYEYILNLDGTLVRKDELEVGIESKVDIEETKLVQLASEEITYSIKASVARAERAIQEQAARVERQKRMRQETLKRRFIKVSSGIAVTAVVATGAYFGWQEWIYKPGIAEDTKRAEFDATEYSIDTPGIELDNQKLLIISPEAFEAIPSFRNGDLLDRPRTVNISSSDDCAELDVKNLEGKVVKIAVSNYNPLGSYSVVAYKSQGKLNICTTEDIDSDITGDDLKIAVQLADSRN